MQNYVTGNEYSGRNEVLLYDAGYEDGDQFVTFKQAVRDLKIAGKALKGIKAAASLVRFVKDDKEETGTRPVYFSVFEINQVLARKK